MRLSDTEHTSRPWRIHELSRDFRLEDVWALPVAGSQTDFSQLVELLAAEDSSRSSSRLARMLWTIRWKIGDVLGWDHPGAGLGFRVRTLSDRLPADLRGAPGPDFAALPFTSLYLIEDEFAAEIANRTVHGVLHVGWVPDSAGGYRGQMAVLVKPNGLLGAGYLAAIKPFRRLIVYPPMIRDIGRRWRERTKATRVRQVALPPAARALSTLSSIDYQDAFFVDVGLGQDRTAEQWARAVLEDAPPAMRRRLLRGWRRLGLKLGSPRSGRRVLGWEVRRSTEGFVLLSASSRIGFSGELLFKREPGGLLFATFIQQRNVVARAVWALMAPTHRRVVRSLLTQAVRRAAQVVEGGGPSGPIRPRWPG
jgi:Protein of unknown function (DUF2867)